MLATRSAGAALPALAPFLAYLRLEVRRALRNRRYLVFTIVFPVVLYVLYTAVLPATRRGHDRRPPVARVLPGLDGRLRRHRRRDEPGRADRDGAPPGLGPPAAGDAAAVDRLGRGQGRDGDPAHRARARPGRRGREVVNHVDIGLGTWAMTVVAMALAAIPFAAIGLADRLPAGPESAQGGMVLTFFSLAILGGLFAPLEAMPAGIATIGRMLPSSHFASLGRSVVGRPGPRPRRHPGPRGLGGRRSARVAAWRYAADERSGRS